jgi:hypothetical protein
MIASARSCTTITSFVLPDAMLKCDRNTLPRDYRYRLASTGRT